MAKFSEIWQDLYEICQDFAISDTIWRCLESLTFGELSRDSARFGMIWHVLEGFDSIWKDLAIFGNIGGDLARFGPTR